MITLQQFSTLIAPKTLKHEGGYANNPNDKGGETYRGIGRKANPNWKGWGFIDQVKRTGEGLSGAVDWVKDKYTNAKNAITTVFSGERYKIPTNKIFPQLENDVCALYYQKYFVDKGFNRINSVEVAQFLFDFAVHGGYSLITLQKLINSKFPNRGKNGGKVAEDGKIGNETFNAINSIGTALLPHLISWRQAHLNNIIKKDPSQKVFEEGWNKRLASFMPAIAAKTQEVKTFVSGNKNYFAIGLAVAVVITVLVIMYVRKKNKNQSKNEDLNNVSNPIQSA